MNKQARDLPIIVGAGPSGLMAAIVLAEAGQKCLVIERQKLPGGKLPVTGGGHCNLTHRGTPIELSLAYHESARFMKHTLKAFGCEDLRQFMRELGLQTYYDEKDCCYPRSRRAEDVVITLYKAALRLGVQFLFGYELKGLRYFADDDCYEYQLRKVKGDRQPAKWPRLEKLETIQQAQTVNKPSDNKLHRCPAVILAAGSPAFYKNSDAPTAISELDLLADMTQPFTAALYALEDTQFSSLAGISLDSARLSLREPSGKVILEECESMLFTHQGISGPLALNFSRHLSVLESAGDLTVKLDFCPSISEAELLERIDYGRSQEARSRVISKLVEELPRRVWPFIMEKSGLDPALRFADCSKRDARALIDSLKSLPLSIQAEENLERGMLARGGIRLSELNSKTLEFKQYQGLYACGECLDVDGRCGGYNLQMAFSTGYLAATALGKKYSEKN
ncbi:MAG: aminoacetone oxidase family FAD-binding enzyme [Eubacteriales bacterium]|nr:aminoacetone oxidase family FAD-binding enzyme [Eubacteriales bacterium]